jgi:hypothetical protein
MAHFRIRASYFTSTERNFSKKIFLETLLSALMEISIILLFPSQEKCFLTKRKTFRIDGTASSGG